MGQGFRLGSNIFRTGEAKLRSRAIRIPVIETIDFLTYVETGRIFPQPCDHTRKLVAWYRMQARCSLPGVRRWRPAQLGWGNAGGANTNQQLALTRLWLRKFANDERWTRIGTVYLYGFHSFLG